MKLYIASKYENEIKVVEYERVTAKFAVKANGRRDALDTEYDALRLTRDEAVQWRRDLLNRRLLAAKSEVKRIEKDLADFEFIASMLPDLDYSCGAAFCDDPACVTHNPNHPNHDV